MTFVRIWSAEGCVLKQIGVNSLSAKPEKKGKWNPGKRADLNGMYFRSKWEANYARYLNLLIKQNYVKKWKYEAEEFEFPVKRGTRFYKPDFKVWDKKGQVEYHEIKGWRYQKGETALKRMARYFPSITVRVIGVKEYREIARKCRIIENWE